MRAEPPKTDKATNAVEEAPEGKNAFRRSDLGRCGGDFEGSGARITKHGRPIRVARRTREHDDHDVPVPVYDPYGSGNDVDVITDV